MDINNPDTDFLYKLASIINWDLTGSCLFFLSQSGNHMLVLQLPKSVHCSSLENIGLRLWNFDCWFQLFTLNKPEIKILNYT